LEKQYQITSNDIKILKAFLQGKTHMYDKTNPKSRKYTGTSNVNMPVGSDIYGKQDDNNNKMLDMFFPSMSFKKKDPRMKKMEKILKDRKEKIEKNSGAYRQNCDIPNGNERYQEQLKSSEINYDTILDSRDLADKNVYGLFKHNRQDGINNMNSISIIDRDSNDLNNFRINETNKYYNKSYTSGPTNNDNIYNFQTNMPNIIYDNNNSIEDIPINTKKTYGYPNPGEHYFQYLDDTFYNIYETGDRGGYPTRIDNRKMNNELNPH